LRPCSATASCEPTIEPFKIDNLLPEGIRTIRALYRTALAERPALLASAEALLDDISGQIWSGEAAYTRTYERVTAQMLPLLLEVADSSSDRIEPVLDRAWQRWKDLAGALDHP
jgi:hypothetical protein